MHFTTKLIYLKASSPENHLVMAILMQERDKNISVSVRMRERSEKAESTNLMEMYKTQRIRYSTTYTLTL